MLNKGELAKLLDQNLDKPRVVGLVITKSDNKVNLCPVTWQVISSMYENPIVVCIGLTKTHYTMETIGQTKEFVYAYPSLEQIKDTIYCGEISGKDINMVENTSFAFSKSKFVNPPMLNDAVMNFECKVTNTVPMDDFTIVIGRVVNIVHEFRTFKLN